MPRARTILQQADEQKEPGNAIAPRAICESSFFCLAGSVRRWPRNLRLWLKLPPSRRCCSRPTFSAASTSTGSDAARNDPILSFCPRRTRPPVHMGHLVPAECTVSCPTAETPHLATGRKAGHVRRSHSLPAAQDRRFCPGPAHLFHVELLTQRHAVALIRANNIAASDGPSPTTPTKLGGGIGMSR